MTESTKGPVNFSMMTLSLNQMIRLWFYNNRSGAWGSRSVRSESKGFILKRSVEFKVDATDAALEISSIYAFNPESFIVGIVFDVLEDKNCSG